MPHGVVVHAIALFAATEGSFAREIVRRQSTCQDEITNCALWRSEAYLFCEPSSSGYAYMTRVCARTCGLCDEGRGLLSVSQAEETTIATEISHIDTPSDCSDSSEHCIAWQAQGYCASHSTYFAYMNYACQRTCGFCFTGRSSQQQTTTTSSRPDSNPPSTSSQQMVQNSTQSSITTVPIVSTDGTIRTTNGMNIEMKAPQRPIGSSGRDVVTENTEKSSENGTIMTWGIVLFCVAATIAVGSILIVLRGKRQMVAKSELLWDADGDVIAEQTYAECGDIQTVPYRNNTNNPSLSTKPPIKGRTFGPDVTRHSNSCDTIYAAPESSALSTRSESTIDDGSIVPDMLDFDVLSKYGHRFAKVGHETVHEGSFGSHTWVRATQSTCYKGRKELVGPSVLASRDHDRLAVSSLSLPYFLLLIVVKAGQTDVYAKEEIYEVPAKSTDYRTPEPLKSAVATKVQNVYPTYAKDTLFIDDFSNTTEGQRQERLLGRDSLGISSVESET